jgi:NAD(P)-dependent dehydrogenase (short-subunit alcohol dehydrogenase family)
VFSYQGKRAIVTGAGRGIGRAIALGFATQGADVTLASRTKAQLDEVAEEVRKLGRQAWVRPCDLRDADQAAALVRDAAAEMGGLEILVNCAGGADEDWLGPLEDTTQARFDGVYSLNVRSPFFAAITAVKEMTSRGTRGSILNIVSIDGLVPAPGEAVYGSAKAASISLTQSLAIEVGQYGVRVNAIAPALIDTALVADWLPTETVRAERASYYPLNRIGQPEDIAGAAIYLCSDEAGWVSGVTVPVAGGQQTTSDIFRWVRTHNPVPADMKL